MGILVRAAGGSFIYAVRLRIIIDTILERRKRDPGAGISADGPFAELDAFYTLILRRIPTGIFPSVHLLLAVICKYGEYQGSGGMFVANVLGMSKEEFETVCNHTSAVVHLQKPGKDLEIDPTIDTNCTYAQVNLDVLQKLDRRVVNDLGGRVAFYHKSFEDFLLDPARSGSYNVKGSEALVKHYLRMHLDYDRTYGWEGSELVLAPGVTDSGSSLSYPYTNELVNSLIKANVYAGFGSEDRESFSALGIFGALSADRDFRKNLYVATYLVGGIPSFIFRGQMWGCEFQSKWYPGTAIACAALAKFNVNEFKSMVKQRKHANILRRYYPKWPSRIKSLFCDKSREGFESAVYCLGQGEKSIFWYWEIDYKAGYYKEFQTIDLAEGEKRFREEDFGVWPE